MREIVIIGAGGFAQEVLWAIQCMNPSLPASERFTVQAFVSEVKEEQGKKYHGYPVIAPNHIRTEYAALGFGSPEGKKKFVEKHKHLIYPNIIHPSVTFALGASIKGSGVVILNNVSLMPYSVVNSFTAINVGSVIGHDAVIGAYNTISPGALVMGNCTTGECSYIGVGAAVREKINIGRGCVIGANAAVVKDIPEYSMAVGVPAKVIKSLKAKK